MSPILASLLAGARRRSATVFVAAAVTAALGLALVSRVTFDPDILRLLPRTSPPVAAFRTFLQRFGSLDQLYIVFEAPDAIGGHESLVDAYADILRQAPEIASVDTQLFEPGKDWSYLFDRELYLLGPDGATEALGRFRPDAMDAQLAHARDLLSAPSSQIKAYVQQDPLGLLDVLRARMGRDAGPLAINPTETGYVSADGRSRLLIVKPTGAPFDSDFCKALFQRLATVERDARTQAAPEDSGLSSVTIQAAGAYRVSLESEALIRREAIVNSVGSMVLLLLMVFALFRTPRVMLYGIVPLTMAAVLALGISGALKGALSPATSGSAGMLFGLGIDGIIVLYVRYLEERESGRGADEAVVAMAPAAWSVILAQTTTAATFFGLLLIDFPTLQDLGGLVGTGILICCALTLLLMPAFLGRDRTTRRAPGLRSPWLGALVDRGAGPIVGAGLLATVVLGAAASRLHIDTGIDRLQAQTRGAALEREIAERFSLPRDILLVLGEHEQLEPLLDADARLTTTLRTSFAGLSVNGVSMLMPPASVQRAVADRIRASGVTAATLGAELSAAGERAGFRPGVFEPFLQRAPRILDADERITHDGLVAHGLGPVAGRFVARADGRYYTVAYLYPRQPIDLDRLGSIVHEADPSLRLTGVPIVNRDLARRFMPQFTRGLAIGTAAVALIVLAAFRSFGLTVLALLPTAVGFVWSAGLLAIGRVELDLFSMFATVTFVGMAVDYGIYVLYRYALEGRPMPSVLTESGAAIIIACATALVGFGTLVNSSYGPLRTFGIVSLVTLTCCLAASVLLLPSLVLVWERWSHRAR